MPGDTGPTTPEGKARASLNAVKHGLTATAMIIPGLESEDDWQTFYDGVVAYYGPVGAVEFALVERAAGLHWRLRRVPRAERDATLNATIDDVTLPPHVLAMQEMAKDLEEWMYPPEALEEDEKTLLQALARERIREMKVGDAPGPAPGWQPRSLPEPVPLLTLSKYEARLDAQLRHVIREIENCQNRRRRARTIPLHAL